MSANNFEPMLVMADLHIADGKRWQPWRRFLTTGEQVDVVCQKIERQLGFLPQQLVCAGDMGAECARQELDSRFETVHAVSGNADDKILRQEQPGHIVLKPGNSQLLVIHGWGSPRYIIDRITRRYGWDWDGIIFGHTHRPLATIFEDTLCMNPGSPTDIRIAKQRTFGLLAPAEYPFDSLPNVLGHQSHHGIGFAVLAMPQS